MRLNSCFFALLAFIGLMTGPVVQAQEADPAAALRILRLVLVVVLVHVACLRSRSRNA